MRRAAMLATVFAVVLAPAASAHSKDARPADFPVRVKERVIYGQGQVNQPAAGKFDLLLDLYKPATKSKRRRPAVVLIHGGSFRGGARNDPTMVQIGRGLAARGVVVASIDYRLIGQDPVNSARVGPVTNAEGGSAFSRAMIAAVDDTLTAFDWLRAHASRYRIDRKRLGIIGSSAGAITANHVAYLLDDYGVKAPRVRFVGDLWGAILISPGARALERGEAPLFAVHGSEDRVVPTVLDDQLVARARAEGVPVEYFRVPGGHGAAAVGFFTREVLPGQTAFDRMVRFAGRRLLRRRGWHR
jgi:acetyl esterase/lipase